MAVKKQKKTQTKKTTKTVKKKPQIKQELVKILAGTVFLIFIAAAFELFALLFFNYKVKKRGVAPHS